VEFAADLREPRVTVAAVPGVRATSKLAEHHPILVGEPARVPLEPEGRSIESEHGLLRH